MPVLGYPDWPRCPIAMLRDDVAFHQARRYYDAKQIAGVLEGFPDDFAAWAEEAITEIHVAVEKKQADDLTEQAKRGK
jgi:hypothetical protein